jgi:hypothetical protein
MNCRGDFKSLTARPIKRSLINPLSWINTLMFTPPSNFIFDIDAEEEEDEEVAKDRGSNASTAAR